MSLPTREIIEAFIIRNAVDVDAANSLLDQRPDVQQEVLGRGDVVRHRNPSAALQKHIKEAKLLMNSMARTRHAVALGEMQQFGPASGYGFSDPLYTYAVGAPQSTGPTLPAAPMLDDRPAAAAPRGRGRGRSPSRSPSFGGAVWAQQRSPSPEREMCVNPIFGRRAGAAKAQAEDESPAAARDRSRKKSRNRSKSRRKGDEKKARTEKKAKSKQEEKDKGGELQQRRFQEEEPRRAKDEERSAGKDGEQRSKLREKRRDKSEERRQRKHEGAQQLQHLEESDAGKKAQSDSQAGGFEEIRQRMDDLQRRQDDRKRRRDEVTRQLQKLEEDVRQPEPDSAPAAQDGSASKVEAPRASKRKAS